MINLNKSREFFDPDNLNDEIHIIGVGAVGSTIAENLTRLGVKEIHIYDFDTVSEHNIANQMFLHHQINMPKVDAIEELLKAINPEINVVKHEKGFEPDKPYNMNIIGHVFMCVDNIELRQTIVKELSDNEFIKVVYDVRMRLEDAQHYAATWNKKGQQFLLSTMSFTSAEAEAATPVSACGVSLSVNPTVRLICAYAVSNFINKTTKNELYKTILIDAFNIDTQAYKE